MTDDGVLVSRKWLEKVDSLLFGGTSEEAPPKKGGGSLFYGLRPARLASSWELVGGVYRATCRFITNGAAETNAYPVFAPTATSDPKGTVGETRFFVVYRGRWEMVSDAGSLDSEVSLESVVKTVSATKTRLYGTVGLTPSLILTSSDEAGVGKIPYVHSVECVDGEMIVATKYLDGYVQITGQNVTILPAVDVVTNVSSTRQERVMVKNADA